MNGKRRCVSRCLPSTQHGCSHRRQATGSIHLSRPLVLVWELDVIRLKMCLHLTAHSQQLDGNLRSTVWKKYGMHFSRSTRTKLALLYSEPQLREALLVRCQWETHREPASTIRGCSP